MRWGRRRRAELVAAVVTSLGALLLSSPSVAVPPAGGDIDTNFGSGGNVVVDFGAADLAYALATDSRGRTVLGGQTTAAVDGSDLAVVRLLPNGNLDPSFGSGGRVVLDLGSGAAALAIAITDDGSIVVAGRNYAPGTSAERMLLVRLLAGGDLDPTFGVGGIVQTAYPAAGWALALETNGNAVVGGNSIVARFLASGTPDTSFGTAGVTQPTDVTNIQDVALQPDGAIVVGGQWNDNFVVARLLNSGTPDATFGSGGRAEIDLGGPSVLEAVELQSDGSVVASGSVNTSSFNTDFALLRLTSIGATDSTFGAGGIVTTNFAVGDFASGLAVQDDGKIVAGGTIATTFTGSSDIGLARYLSNGQLDSSFGSGGKVLTNLGRLEFPERLALQQDGKIVIAGFTTSNNGYSDADFQVVRYIAGQRQQGRCPQCL